MPEVGAVAFMRVAASERGAGRGSRRGAQRAGPAAYLGRGGSPAYMSPEQCRGEAIDGRSDLYSLGVIGYQMLSGTLPFQGDNLRDVLVQHVTKDPVPLKDLVPSIPPDLEETITDCLAKEPDSRIADGLSFQRKLGINALAGRGEEEVPVELEDHLGGWRGFFFISGALVIPGVVGLSIYGGLGWSVPIGLGWLLHRIPLSDIRRQIKKGGLKGYTVKEVLRWVFMKPRWWTSWWPRSLRRNNDLWERYPSALKSMHKSFGAWVALFLSFTLLVTWVNFALADSAAWSIVFMNGLWSWVFKLTWVLTAMLIGAGVWNMGRLYRQARAAGLNREDARRLFSPPPPRSTFWQKPEVQQFLLPEEGTLPILGEAVPQTPTGYLQALSGAAKAFDGPRKLLAEEAGSAAREIHRAIEAVDIQVEDLVTSTDPAEIARYKQRLEALGSPSENEPASKRKMRGMLRQQLDLAQGLADQIEEARERRNRLLDMLETLWLQVASLKAQSAADDFDSSEISQKVRSIAEDVQRYREASEETVQLLETER